MEGTFQTLSTSLIDLDIEGGELQFEYDSGLSWPFFSSTPASWSSKGPATIQDLPRRLDLLHTIQYHWIWIKAGWKDGNRWNKAFQLIQTNHEIRNGIVKGLVLSATVSALVVFFQLAFFPTVLFQSSTTTTTELTSVIWLYPLIGASYLVASFWTTNVAQAAFRIRHGGEHPSSSSRWSWSWQTVLPQLYRLFFIINYTLIFVLLEKIPYFGRIFSFLFMCLIDGYYCFEQAWISRGWSVERRMRYCEQRWTYFIAFGLPSTAVSFFHPSGLLNLMLFMMVFPFSTVLAMLAETDVVVINGGGGRRMSYFLPARVAVFWPTVMLHRLLLRISNQSAFLQQQQHPSSLPSDGYRTRIPSGTAAQLVGGIWAGTRIPSGGGGATATWNASAATPWSPAMAANPAPFVSQSHPQHIHPRLFSNHVTNPIPSPSAPPSKGIPNHRKMD